MSRFIPFSEKQLRVMTWWCEGSGDHEKDAIICDGAVRSGKTFCMSLSFVLWSLKAFDGHAFALCGKTISSLRRNVITPLLGALPQLSAVCEERISKNYLDIRLGSHQNRYYLFGGKDEASASLIQGMTLSGVFFDEVALMPRSFVEQALARCSVTGSKFWFNCNPEHPYHYFYLEWIQKTKEKNALYLHFDMHDNPSLSPDIIRRYESLYSGAFYERFIKGKWVQSEGVIYTMFDPKIHVVKEPPCACEQFYISIDYGTRNPASFGLWGFSNGTWYRLKEYYHDSKKRKILKTDNEYYQDLKQFAFGYPIQAIIVDPSAASFIECIRRAGEYRVIPAKNEVLTGIKKVMDALRERKIMFCAGCDDTFREFSLYRWEDRTAGDAPKKEFDHAMDEIRYFVSTVLQQRSIEQSVFVSVGRLV